MLVDTYYRLHNFMEEYRDRRVDGWFLMSSPLPTILICLTYVWVMRSFGPRLMKNRQPFELRRTMIVYNFLQMAFSIWNLEMMLRGGWGGSYSFKCQPVDYSNSPEALTMASASWWYYFSKFTEFFDTLFFVLRKKFEHISTLHVVHHGIMPFSVWFGVKFTPGGHSTFFGLVNTLVHIIMYFYYLIAAMGPKYQKYLWWKKHLTTVQMIQFVMIFTHSFQLFFRECNYPRAFSWWIGGHGILFLILFSNFYRQAYLKKSVGKSPAKPAKLSDIIPCLMHQETYDNSFRHANGQINGYAKGLNGFLKEKEHTNVNGYVKGLNGCVKENGFANGHVNGYINGYAKGLNWCVRENGFSNGFANGHVVKDENRDCDQTTNVIKRKKWKEPHEEM